MSDLQDADRLLEAAEQAAVAGDLAAADELLKSVARIQEAELGSLHPDLANTLNNLAIVAEKVGRLDDAETFFRRAVRIASASLPSNDPRIDNARKNLEDFCRANGVAIDLPAVVAPVESAPAAVATPAVSTPTTAPAASRRPSRTPSSVVIVFVAAVALVIAAIIMKRSSSSQEPSTAAPAAAPTPIEQPRPAAPVPQSRDRSVPAAPPPAPARSSSAMTLATAEVCQTFSTSGTAWRCDPAADSVSPGSMVLYTRVRSPTDASVVHRWYRGEVLKKSATLRVGANATEGYRTYSRQTVDRADWHVQVMTAEGIVLYERRFVVK
jgi:hypothetical protein